MLKIKLTKKRLYPNLFMSMLWIVLGSLDFFLGFNTGFDNTAYLMLGLGYLAVFYYDYKNQYLIIKNGWIRKNLLYSFKNKIKIGDITEIDRIDGNYLLKSEKGNLKIKPDLIEKASLKRLNEELVSWGLPPEKTVFYS